MHEKIDNIKIKTHQTRGDKITDQDQTSQDNIKIDIINKGKVKRDHYSPQKLAISHRIKNE